MTRRTLAEQLLDNARHQREVIEFISLGGPDHPNRPDYLRQLREYRRERLALQEAQASVLVLSQTSATPAPANIPFPVRRSA